MSKSKTIQLTPIGVIHCDLQSLADTPKIYSESDRSGVLEIYPEYEEALEGITAGQTVVALFWLHKARKDILKVHPRGDRSRPLRGVFATRSPVRPNPIGLSEFKVIDVQGCRLTVTGVDVIDGTPLLDLKKKIE